MNNDTVAQLCSVAERMAEMARKAGADDAEVVVRDGAELEVKVRRGETELVKEASSRALGLRVFKDRRAALTYTSDFDTAALEKFAADSVALAALAEPDELNTLPDRSELSSGELPDLALWDDAVGGITTGEALDWCRRGEKAALDFDKRVTNSEGASFGRTVGSSAFATTGGFVGGYRGTYVSFFVEPLCDDEGGKKRNGHWWTGNRFRDKLDAPEAVGAEAARRTVAKLGSRKVDTAHVPIVFDPEAGRALLRDFFSVANGSAFYRKSSFLVGKEGQEIASKLVTIVDDPLIDGAPGSRPFDGDGLASRRNVVVAEGILETILCDTYSARKLGRKSTASAGRAVGGSPGPTTSNLVMQPGKDTPESVRDIERGLYVTDMMGFGFNGVTGDFSRGAGGFWIENGELTFPVSEVTISSSFLDMLQGIDAVADDLELRTSTACPTFRIREMTIGGS